MEEDSTEEHHRDDRVGYRRPPRNTRFAKGKSGNPAGRPRGRHKHAPYEAVLGLEPATPSHEKARQYLDHPYDGTVPAG